MQRPGEEAQGAGPVTLGPEYNPADLLDQNIANLLKQYNLKPAAPKEKKGPQPPGTRTSQEQEADILTVALEDLGIKLSDKDFVAFAEELSAQFGLDSYRGRFKGKWEDWVKGLAQRRQEPLRSPGGEFVGEQPVVGSAPLETKLADWLDEQEALKAAAAAPKRLAALQEAAGKERKYRDDLTKAQLKDALADLKRRYPNNKNVIDILGAGDPTLGLPSAFEGAWDQFNARQRDEWASLPPELQGILGGQGADVPVDSFVRGMDIGQLAADEGLGADWQDGTLKDALQRQVYDPMLAAAKTPQDKLSAERKIAQLQGSYAGLKRQFDFAQQQDPTMTADAFMAGDGGAAVAQAQANDRILLNEDIKALAAKGQSRAQIAAQLTLGSADFANAADALRQGENIAAEIKKAAVLKQNGEYLAAARSYANAISQLDPRTTGSAEDIARSLGTTIPALQELQGYLGPKISFMQYLTDTAAQNRQLTQFSARQSIGPANVLPVLQRAVAAGTMSTEQAKALIASGQNLDTPLDITFMQNDPRNLPVTDPRYTTAAPVNPMGTTLAQNIEAATEQARVADVFNRLNLQAAQGAQDVGAGAEGIRRSFSDAGQVGGLLSGSLFAPPLPRGQAYSAQLAAVNRELDALRESEGRKTSAEVDWDAIGALEARRDELQFFAQEGAPEFVSRQAGRFASERANELARFSNLGVGQRFPERLASDELYIRSRLPQIGKEFASFQVKQLATIEADKGFAATLTQLLTDFGLRSPGASRNDLLAQNAAGIKRTYEEYLRRSSGAQGTGAYSLAQQRQLIGGGIL